MEDENRGRYRALVWLYLGLLVVLSFVPVPGPEGGPRWMDKGFHLAGYFFFVYFFLLAADFKARAFAWVLAAALALLTESVQDLLPWRDASLLDVAFGVAGATLATVLPRRAGLWLLRNFSTLFFVGYLPKAPGTWASLITLGVLYLAPLSPPVIFMILMPLLLLAFWSSAHAETLWGRDPQKVVVDECVGAGLAVMFLPKTAVLYGLGFLLFRAVDILKPPPVRQLDQMEGPGAVVLDDMAGGIIVNLVLWALVWFTGIETVSLKQIIAFLLG